MSLPRIGVFCGYDPRPWVMKDCAEGDIVILNDLVGRLRDEGRFEVVYPGEKLTGFDKLCYKTELCQSYAEQFHAVGVVGLLNVHQTWTFPQTSQMVMSSYKHLLRGDDATAVPRIVLASIQDTTVPGMVSGMATAGAYLQNGDAYNHVYGDFEAEAFWAELNEVLAMFATRAECETSVRSVVRNLHKLHALEFGSFSLQMPTTRINQEELTKRWGITSESLDQQVFLDRAFGMFEWAGEPGRSEVVEILDDEVREAVEGIYDATPEKFTVLPDREVSRGKYALQVAMYVAVRDIADEKGAGAVTIKCQDECSGQYATCCQATSFLGNDVDMNGRTKRMIPTSCETDMPTMYTQFLLKELTGEPSGFGDFRYVKTERKNGHEETLLAIVNCGQHPQYFAGHKDWTQEQKVAATEYPGQEHFYAAGGAAVRLRTSGGQQMTVARLGVENGRLYMVACPLQTVDVEPSRHEAYNRAWPIIEGTIPISDRVMGRKWPSNHLGFVYGDWIPQLVELSERMGIGYLMWDTAGREYSRPS